jgi:type II secretory pathway component PulJ
MSIPSPSSDGEQGFTLVEALVSLTMLTLVLVGLMQIFSLGFRSIRVSEFDAAAIDLAHSQLVRVSNATPLEAGEQRGSTSDGLAWSVVVEPRDSQKAAGGPQAFWITSEVRWRSSAFVAAQSVSLRSLRVKGTP